MVSPLGNPPLCDQTRAELPKPPSHPQASETNLKSPLPFQLSKLFSGKFRAIVFPVVTASHDASGKECNPEEGRETARPHLGTSPLCKLATVVRRTQLEDLGLLVRSSVSRSRPDLW